MMQCACYDTNPDEADVISHSKKLVNSKLNFCSLSFLIDIMHMRDYANIVVASSIQCQTVQKNELIQMSIITEIYEVRKTIFSSRRGY